MPAVSPARPLLAVLAVRLPRARPGDGAVPARCLVGAVTLAAGATFMLGVRLPGWTWVAAMLVLDALLAVLLVRWSTRPGWTPRHLVAAAGGALLTYAWHAFPEQPVVPVAPEVDLLGNALFAAAALALLVVAVRRSACAAGCAPVTGGQRPAGCG